MLELTEIMDEKAFNFQAKMMARGHLNHFPLSSSAQDNNNQNWNIGELFPWIFVEIRNCHSPKPQTLKPFCSNTVKSRPLPRGNRIYANIPSVFRGQGSWGFEGYIQNLKTLPKIFGLEPWNCHNLPNGLVGATLTTGCQTLSCVPTAKETTDVVK